MRLRASLCRARVDWEDVPICTIVIMIMSVYLGSDRVWRVLISSTCKTGWSRVEVRSGGSPSTLLYYYLTGHTGSQDALRLDESTLATAESALHPPTPSCKLPSPALSPNDPMVSETVSPLPPFCVVADIRLIFLHRVPWPFWAEYDNPEKYGLARMSPVLI